MYDNVHVYSLYCTLTNLYLDVSIDFIIDEYWLQSERGLKYISLHADVRKLGNILFKDYCMSENVMGLCIKMIQFFHCIFLYRFNPNFTYVFRHMAAPGVSAQSRLEPAETCLSSICVEEVASSTLSYAMTTFFEWQRSMIDITR